MKSLPLLAVLTLFIGLSSCLPDAAATLTPEVVEVEEEPEFTTNFTVNGNALEVNFGYLFKVSTDNQEEQHHHLVLTANEVNQSGEFTGSSEAITITIKTAADADLNGEYLISGNNTNAKRADEGRYYQNLGFNRADNYEQGYYNRGTVLISRQGDEYVISLDLSTSFGVAGVEGTFRGEVAEIDLAGNEPADDSRFQGPNQLIYGEREVGLNHAYLVKYGNADSGPQRYRLYLSQQDIAPDASTLTGRSDLIFFYVDGNVIERGGKFTFAADNNNYLSQFRTQVNNGYYCKNMDFLRNTADEDIPVEKGEIDVEVDGEEIIIAFTGQANSGNTTNALYRGPMIRLD